MRLSAKASVWIAVSLAVWCASSAPTLAQTYDFTFSGGGASIPNGILTLSGSNVTSVSGTLSGVSPSNDNGNISLLDTLFPPPVYSSSRNYVLSFEVNTSDGGTDDFLFTADNSEIDPYNGSIYSGTSTVRPTPSPIPGSGPLSYLLFGFGGLFINRKRVWRAARMAGGIVKIRNYL
jgi:hypothetical protein